MLPNRDKKISPEEYLISERESKNRHEYCDGEVYAMVGASRRHNLISSNIVRTLGNQLLERPCNVFSSDMKVKVDEIGKYTYPDIVVACDKEQYEDENEDVLLNPVAIIEILSYSTEAYDRGNKFEHYQHIHSLVEYILVSQYDRKVEKFVRRDDDTWTYTKYCDNNQVVALETVQCELPVSEIYRKVIFEEPARRHGTKSGFDG